MKKIYFSKTSYFFPEPNQPQQTIKPAIQSIDAVREVLITLLNEHHQRQVIAVSTTTPIGSRLRNTTGINITDEAFTKMMEDKAANKKKRGI